MDAKKIIAAVLSFLCGAVFIFSGVSKLLPIEPFEISLVDIGVASWKLAPVFARLMIGLEFTLGFFFVFLFRLRKITIPVAAALLVAFIVYLLLLIHVYGDKGNCGCFGEVVVMTPLQAILKNIALLIALAIIYTLAGDYHFRFKNGIAVFGLVVLMVLPFILNQMSYPFETKPISEFKHFPLDTATVYKNYPVIPDSLNINSGKHIVAVLSLKCHHCKTAAQKLGVIHKKNPQIPILFIFSPEKDKVQQFLDNTKTQNIPRIVLNNGMEFMQLTGGSFPRLYWTDRDTVVYETNYYQLEQADIEKWLNGNSIK